MKNNIIINKDYDEEISCPLGKDKKFKFTFSKNGQKKLHPLDNNFILNIEKPNNTNEDKKNKINKKGTLFLVILILLSIIIICLFIGLLILKNKINKLKKEEIEKDTNRAKIELKNCIKIDSGDINVGGTNEIDKSKAFIDADGKLNYISEKSLFNEEILSDIAKIAIQIENNPNGAYYINNRMASNPQANYIENSIVIGYFAILEKKEDSLNLTDIKSFTYGLNHFIVDKEIIEAMASYTRKSNGTIIFKKTYAIIMLDKDNEKLTYNLYTRNGILLLTYLKENYLECIGVYGYFDGNKNIAFPEYIQNAISEALKNIESKYPKYKLSSLINQCS